MLQDPKLCVYESIKEHQYLHCWVQHRMRIHYLQSLISYVKIDDPEKLSLLGVPRNIPLLVDDGHKWAVC